MKRNSHRGRRTVNGITEEKEGDRYLCPCCLRYVSENETVCSGHHVVWKMDGGHSLRWNLLRICQVCHGTVTVVVGEPGEEAYRIHMACVGYMLARYGLLFEFQRRDRYIEPLLRSLPDNLGFSTLQICRVLDRTLRVVGREFYRRAIKREPLINSDEPSLLDGGFDPQIRPDVIETMGDLLMQVLAKAREEPEDGRQLRMS